MPHYYVRPESVKDGRFVIEGNEAHHLAVVLRKKPGDVVLLFDAAGGNFRAHIETVAPDKVAGAILSEAAAPKLPYNLRLFQGLPKGDKFEWVLQKMTELGAAEIIPVYTERSVAKIPHERVSERLKRWERIVMSAAKQCGLSRVPTVHAPRAFDQAFALCEKTDLTLLPWESEEKSPLREFLRPPAAGADARQMVLEGVSSGGPKLPEAVNVFIGPEGGFTHKEVELAKRHGGKTVTLGPLILRTETAGLFVASALMYERMGKETL